MKLILRIVALAAILLPAAPASAIVYTVDWTGILRDGVDVSHIFFPVETDLAGQTVHLAFRVATQTPGATKGPDQFGAFVSGQNAASPVTAFVTINGVTFEMLTHPVYVPSDPFNIFIRNTTNPTFGGAIEWNQTPGVDEIDQAVSQVDNIQVYDQVGNRFVNIMNSRAEANAFSFVADIADLDIETAPISRQFTSDDNVFASFYISSLFEETFLNDGTSPPPHVYYEEFAHGSFIPTSYTVTINDAGSAVPEPTAWALMIVGFASVGAALRRRATRRGFRSPEARRPRPTRPGAAGHRT